MRHTPPTKIAASQIGIAITASLVAGTLPAATADPRPPNNDQPNRISVQYGKPNTRENHAIRKLLEKHRALE
jgi:hypothetical protein